ncbi:AAA family ATPase [Catenuloplanes indicus]|uniref:WD40 repeat protein n=1 Tax=Catenuloplanes indicus TaxID=137267 RepID=A0AAE3VVM0_9ACTN|nr:AAA family ATPase [Catenuloplanes indicus]MDQ0364042.1 WD40 repeat protein [Catenuloplanes indicus]
MDDHAAERARQGLRAWVRDAGRQAQRAGPYAVLALVTASAIAPVAAVALQLPAAFAAALGQIGGIGVGVLTDTLTRTARRFQGRPAPSEERWRAAIAAELEPLLASDGENGRALRAEVARLLRTVDAVETTLTAVAADDVRWRDDLVTAFTVLGTDIGELRWMVADSRRVLDQVQDRLAVQSVELHARLDGIRRQLIAYAQLRSSGAAPEQPVPAADAVCPYPGLSSFQPEDAPFFHGRDRETAMLLGRLAEQRVGGPPLVVTGVSGAGKSSLLRAGLLPAIAAGGLGAEATAWPWVLMTPGEHPLTELSVRIAALTATGTSAGRRDTIRRLTAEGQRPVIVVDQFEELFTRCADPAERISFADALAGAAPALVVIGVRADFYAACTELPPLARMLAAGLTVVEPLGDEELRRVVTEPAARAGLAVEPGLTELLLRDLTAPGTPGHRYEPGTLPLLAHALHATWVRREGLRLTVAGYRATGGIHHAVAETAENIYLSLDPGGRERLRTAMLGLVTIAAGGTPVRRRGPRGSIDPEVLRLLVSARLLTAGDDTVEISHEALLTSWPRLADWLATAREDLLLRQRLGDAADDWHASGRDPDLLLRGARLAAARELTGAPGSAGGTAPPPVAGAAPVTPADAGTPGPADVYRDYLEASTAAAGVAERARRRRTHRLRVLASALGVALLLAVAGVVVAVDQGGDAQQRRREAVSRQLAMETLTTLGSDDLTAMRRAVAAWAEAPTAEARGALLSAQMTSASGSLGTGFGGPAAAVSPDGSLIAVGHVDGHVELWNTATLTRTGPDLVAATGQVVLSLSFSPDGRHLAISVPVENGVQIWDVPAGTLRHRLPALGAAAWLPGTGTLVAMRTDVTGDHQMGGWTAETGARTLSFGIGDLVPFDLAVSPDGAYAAVADNRRGAAVWRIRDGVRLMTVPDTVRVALAPGGVLVTNGTDGVIRTWRVDGGAQIATLTDPARSRAPDPLVITPTNRLLTFGTEQRAHLNSWPLPDGLENRGFVGFTGAPNTAAISADGRVVVVSGTEAPTAVFRRGDNWIFHPRPVVDAVPDPTGPRVAAVSRDGTFTITNIETHATVRREETGLPAHDLRIARDGTIAISTSDGRVQVRAPDGTVRGEVKVGGADRFGTPVEIEFSPDGSVLAATGSGPPDEDGFPTGLTMLVDMRTLQPRGTLDTGGDSVSDLLFSPDGSTVSAIVNVTGELDRPTAAQLVTWRVANLLRLSAHPVGTRQIVDADRSPDGRQVAVGGVDRHIQIYAADGSGPPRTFGTHPGMIIAVAWSPDGRTLATATDVDNTIRLWDAATGTLTAQLTGHVNLVAAITFRTPELLVTASADNTAGLWDLDPAAALDSVCRVLVPAEAAAGRERPAGCP